MPCPFFGRSVAGDWGFLSLWNIDRQPCPRSQRLKSTWGNSHLPARTGASSSSPAVERSVALRSCYKQRGCSLACLAVLTRRAGCTGEGVAGQGPIRVACQILAHPSGACCSMPPSRLAERRASIRVSIPAWCRYPRATPRIGAATRSASPSEPQGQAEDASSESCKRRPGTGRQLQSASAPPHHGHMTCVTPTLPCNVLGDCSSIKLRNRLISLSNRLIWLGCGIQRHW